MSRRGKRRAVVEDVEEETSTRRVPTVTTEARMMRPEQHPWLNWPDATPNQRIELNNKLATIQGKPIAQPRFLDWATCDELGIMEQLDGLFLTKYVEDYDEDVEIPVWKRAFGCREYVYREWCLEFYSSLKLDKLPASHLLLNTPVIGFRMGGAVHKVTITQFGVLTGLYTPQDVEKKYIARYQLAGEMNADRVKSELDKAWEELSGCSKFIHSASRAKSIRSPIMKVLQKMIAYSFFQRASQQDKAYIEDIWLLDLFSWYDSTKYVNVPWALVSYMNEKGSGRQRNSSLLCGHFITKIAKSLGLATTININMCSPPITWRWITIQDLKTVGAVGRDGKLVEERGSEEEDMDEEEPEDEEREIGAGGSTQHTQPASSFDNQRMYDEIMRIGQQMDRTQGLCNEMRTEVNRTRREVHRIGEYMEYHTERYQPTLEYMTRQYHQEVPEAAQQWSEYAPPILFPFIPPENQGGQN